MTTDRAPAPVPPAAPVLIFRSGHTEVSRLPNGYYRVHMLTGSAALSEDGLERLIGMVAGRERAAGREQAAADIRAWLRGEIETWPPPVTLAEVGKGAAEVAEGSNHAD